MLIYWIVISIIGWSVVGLGTAFAGSNIGGLIICWIVAGAFMGTFQVQLLLHRIEPYRWWAATLLGLLLGSTFYVLISALIFGGGDGLSFVLSLGMGGLAAGCILGFSQWKFGAFPQLTFRWVLGSALAWGLGAISGYLFTNLFLCNLVPLSTMATFISSEGVVGLFIGLVTGYLLPKSIGGQQFAA